MTILDYLLLGSILFTFVAIMSDIIINIINDFPKND